MKNALSFEHKILRELRRVPLKGHPLLLAVSGGVDSMVMLECVQRWSQLLKVKLHVAHVHHGHLPSGAKRFRDRAFLLVKSRAEKLGVAFLSNAVVGQDKKVRLDRAPRRELRGEAELRDYRYKLLKSWCADFASESPAILLLAHSQDDLLETRILRLVRGTGYQGFEAMKVFHDHLARPLLNVSRKEIVAYARQRHIKWIEDPSNRQLDPQRNWLRRKWLPSLEKRMPGACAALSRSFATILQQGESQEIETAGLIQDGTIDRSAFLELSAEGQRRVLARYMRDLGMKNYSQRHIAEILKRLDNGRKRHIFKLLMHVWTIDDLGIRASRV